MPLIERFKINNLHNYYDVELKFKNNKTIYIGENGIGKTTILSMLYYLLDLNYERFSKYIFDSLEIEFEGKKSFSITKHDITQRDSVVRNRNGRYQTHRFDELIEKIQEDENLVKELSNLDNSTNFISNAQEICAKNPFRELYRGIPCSHRGLF